MKHISIFFYLAAFFSEHLFRRIAAEVESDVDFVRACTEHHQRVAVVS